MNPNTVATLLLITLALQASCVGRRPVPGPTAASPTRAPPRAQPRFDESLRLQAGVAHYRGIPLGVAKGELLELGATCRPVRRYPSFEYLSCDVGEFTDTSVDLHDGRITAVSLHDVLSGQLSPHDACLRLDDILRATAARLGNPKERVTGYCDPEPRDYAAASCATWTLGNGILMIQAKPAHHNTERAEVWTEIVIDEPGTPRHCEQQAPIRTGDE